MCYSPWGCKELDMTKQLNNVFLHSLPCFLHPFLKAKPPVETKNCAAFFSTEAKSNVVCHF